MYRYGYSGFININICGNNLDDVRELTEIAHDNGVATDYHICESPLTEQSHFKHLDNNPTYVTEKHWDKVDGLLDWVARFGQFSQSRCVEVLSACRLSGVSFSSRNNNQHTQNHPSKEDYLWLAN